jgi:hypothetical protein
MHNAYCANKTKNGLIATFKEASQTFLAVPEALGAFTWKPTGKF